MTETNITNPKRQLRQRFTLIELLVVISIIAVLAAILLPALQRAKNKAQTVICVSQFKQAGVAFNLYSDDSGGFAPRPAGGNPQSSASWDGWDFLLADYLEATYVNPWNGKRTLKPHPQSLGWNAAGHLDNLKMYCPAYERRYDVMGHIPEQVWKEPKVATWVTFWGVGSCQMNTWLGLYGVTLSNRNYQLPTPHASFHRLKADTMLMAEEYYNSRLYFNPKHGNRSTLLFPDGRVELARPEDIPGSTCTWCINSPNEMGNQNPESVDFWGWYMLKYYPDPSTVNW